MLQETRTTNLSHVLPPGSKVDRYVIAGVLGQGGMGIVYEATDPDLGRKVAVKVLAGTAGLDPLSLRRFRTEAVANARLNHPNVVSVYDLVHDDRLGVDSIVMELVEGKSARGLLDAGGAVPWLEATRIVADVGRGLAAAHAAGLVHRDLKPGNIICAADGAKLGDFGLAKIVGSGGTKLTGTGQALGTPDFMSPEQCRSEPVDERTDIYSLGATYFALLTGRSPFKGESAMAVMFAHCTSPIPDPRALRPEVPERCAAIVRRAMAKAPGDRYANATALVAELDAVLAANSVTRRDLPASAFAARKAQDSRAADGARGRLLAALATAGGLVLLAVLAASGARTPSAAGPPVPAETASPAAAANVGGVGLGAPSPRPPAAPTPEGREPAEPGRLSPSPALSTTTFSPGTPSLSTPSPTPPEPSPAGEATVSESPAPVAAPTNAVALGTNLAGLDDWGSDVPFADVFKTSRPWISTDRNGVEDQRKLDLDARGWVRSLQRDQHATTYMLTGLGKHRPTGKYVVTYEGEGTLVYGDSARRVAASPGRDEIQVDPVATGGTIVLEVVATNPANYVRNIRVLLPNAGPRELFNPAFIEKLKPFRVIRFASWILGGTHDEAHALEKWSDRPTLDDARWSTKGAPVEVLCALANQVGADPWFTISHRASDDYVDELARAVKAGLKDPKRTVYFELSDQVWNEGFSVQATEVPKKAKEQGLETCQYQARCSRRVFSRLEAVFARERLVRVLGSFCPVSEYSEGLLAFDEAGAHADALAIGLHLCLPTGTPEDCARVERLSVDEVFREVETVELPTLSREIQKQAEVAAKFHLPLIAYAAGVAFVAPTPTPALARLLDAANHDPRTGPLTTRLLETWTAAGGGLFVHRGFCQPDGGGGLDFLDQPRSEAPKHDALLHWSEAAASPRRR